MHAAVDGTMEVLPAVLTSVATTIVAFSPLLFLAGTTNGDDAACGHCGDCLPRILPF